MVEGETKSGFTGELLPPPLHLQPATGAQSHIMVVYGISGRNSNLLMVASHEAYYTAVFMASCDGSESLTSDFIHIESKC